MRPRGMELLTRSARSTPPLWLAFGLSSLSCIAPATAPSPITRAAGSVAQVEVSPPAQPLDWLTRPQSYTVTRFSSYDRTGGNADSRAVPAGETLTLVDTTGPGVISHVWMTIASADPDHLKNLILRMWWDGEETPSVEAPVGAFFGLGLGQYVPFASDLLSVAPDKALNAGFPMPFREHARITIENRGPVPVQCLYYNIDARMEKAPLPADTLYFHAQYREQRPCQGDNYVFLSTEGRGHFLGVTLSVIENADGWWGEGDDMFYVDGEETPSVHGTGTEDYFLGAWDFGGKPFAYGAFGAPVVGAEKKGELWSLYRFHMDAPITFERSIRATIEHGNRNDRADDWASVAYWYQTEPHAAFPVLPKLRR